MNPFKNTEVTGIVDDFNKLKSCVSEWVVAIDSKQYELHQKLKVLEYKLNQIENQLRDKRL